MTDKKYTLTEVLSDVVETSRMVQVSINGRTAMYWDDWIAHIDDAFSEDITPDPQPSGDVVERVSKLLNDWWWTGTVEEGLGPISFEVSKLIESEVQRRMEDRWIPVTERLPETDEFASDDVFWCVCRDGRIIYQGIGNVGIDGKWYKAGISLNYRPTHWQPLPNPPKGAKHE